jgi:hypothetical protein
LTHFENAGWCSLCKNQITLIPCFKTLSDYMDRQKDKEFHIPYKTFHSHIKHVLSLPTSYFAICKHWPDCKSSCHLSGLCSETPWQIPLILLLRPLCPFYPWLTWLTHLIILKILSPEMGGKFPNSQWWEFCYTFIASWS